MSFLDYLLSHNYINKDIHSILSSNTSTDVYDQILEMTNLSEEEVARLQSEYFDLDYTSLNNCVKITGIDYLKFESLLAIPFSMTNNTINIALHNPADLSIKDRIDYYVSSKLNNINIKYYTAKKSSIQQRLKEVTNSNSSILEQTISKALNARASDIHITPFNKVFIIMFRIDGELVEYKTYSIDQYSPLLVSLKVKSKLDISETRRSQSGQFYIGQIDFRLSTHPTIHGENIVIRILNKDKSIINIKSLGFDKDEIEYFDRISKLNQGIIIFCGPTGSGKTTSIYALIDLMDKRSRNIMTLEDPVEYNIPGIRQTEIKPGIIDFVTGIKSILRQDPDVILIGEIRDEETAQMAIRASMTGHLVLTTIHANDSIGAIFRLKHFNIPSQFIAENIIAIISQRLVRLASGVGRTVISEILKPDDQFNNLISINATRSKLLSYAINKLKFKTIQADAISKLKRGLILASDLENKYGIK